MAAHIKTLRRTTARVNGIPLAYGTTSGASRALSSLKGLIGSNDLYDIPYELTREPGVADRIGEYISTNFPNLGVNAATIGTIASKLKMPLVAAVGVAAAAGLAYLVYKLYTNRETIPETIRTFMNDVKSTAPDLSKIPGWFESIKNEVSNAVSGKSPATILERLVKIKNAVLGHQTTIAPAGGSINYFSPTPARSGGGLKVPL